MFLQMYSINLVWLAALTDATDDLQLIADTVARKNRARRLAASDINHTTVLKHSTFSTRKAPCYTGQAAQRVMSYVCKEYIHATIYV